MTATPIPVHLLDRAVTLIGTDTTQARLHIAATVEIVALLPDFVAPNVVRRQLDDVVAKLVAAQSVIDALPHGWQKMLMHVVDGIGHASATAADLANSIPGAPRSGGSKFVRTDAMRKSIAATHALWLLQHYNVNRRHHRRLAALLFEMATGRAADLKRACARFSLIN